MLDELLRRARPAERNVIEGCCRFSETPILQHVWAFSAPTAAHGLVCGLRDGPVRNADRPVVRGRKEEERRE